MKKQRGLRRYYKRLETDNDFEKASAINFDMSDLWFDNWHLHFDWDGFGNHSFRKRKPHLDKLFRHFELLEKDVPKLKSDFQLYAVILDYTSDCDALFLHTPNPNTQNFPYQFEKLKPKTNLSNPQLEDYLSKLKGYEKFYGEAEENYCVLFKKGIGVIPK